MKTAPSCRCHKPQQPVRKPLNTISRCQGRMDSRARRAQAAAHHCSCRDDTPAVADSYRGPGVEGIWDSLLLLLLVCFESPMGAVYRAVAAARIDPTFVRLFRIIDGCTSSRRRRRPYISICIPPNERTNERSTHHTRTRRWTHGRSERKRETRAR